MGPPLLPQSPQVAGAEALSVEAGVVTTARLRLFSFAYGRLTRCLNVFHAKIRN